MTNAEIGTAFIKIITELSGEVAKLKVRFTELEDAYYDRQDIDEYS